MSEPGEYLVEVSPPSGKAFVWSGYAENITDALNWAELARQEEYRNECHCQAGKCICLEIPGQVRKIGPKPEIIDMGEGYERVAMPGDTVRTPRPLGPDDAPHCRHHIQFRSDCEQCCSERASRA
jgi:hypothetical protein